MKAHFMQEDKMEKGNYPKKMVKHMKEIGKMEK